MLCVGSRGFGRLKLLQLPALASRRHTSERRSASSMGGGGGAAPHADLFLAELFGGVKNKPREGSVVQLHQNALARISGLREARIHDLVILTQPDGSTRQGLVIDLELNTVAVALLDQDLPTEGADAVLTGTTPSIRVGPAIVGRVIDPLGRPIPHLETNLINDKAAADSSLPTISLPMLSSSSSQHLAPSIMARKPLCHRLRTGIKALDIFHPIGHGQSVGLLGKPGSGKTTLALQILANQKPSSSLPSSLPLTHCIYVAIGQDSRAITRIVDQLTRAGCIESVTIIAATEDMPPGLRYLAPFAGCAVGEYWRDKGGRALVVFDDLSRHEGAYSEMARFLLKPEVERGLALHGPLLERCAQLSDLKGGGAMTALVLVEGEAVDGEERAWNQEERESGGHGLAHRINSLVDHAINLNLKLAQRKIFPSVDVTQHMNLQSPGMALVPEPAKGCVQQLRILWAEALDDEAGAKLAEELGIQAMEEGEERKVERLEYLERVRVLFEQRREEGGKGGEGMGVDEAGVVLVLLCCLQEEMLMGLEVGTVRELERVLSQELPRAKGWQKLKAQVEGLARQADARTVAEAFWEAHMAAQGRGRGEEEGGNEERSGEATLAYVKSVSVGGETQALSQEAGRVYRRCSDVLTQAINYAQKMQQIAKLMGKGRVGQEAGAGRMQTNVGKRRR